MMNGQGTVEIGGKRIEVSKEKLRRLKLILDELGIMHIIDDITFCSTDDATEVAEGSQSREMCSEKEGGKLSSNNGTGQCKDFEYRELIIPDFFQIDFVSLTQLDNDEAEFIGDLIYGTEFFPLVVCRINR